MASGILHWGLLRRRRTCGPCFRPRRLRRSPGAHGPGLMRLAPAGGERFSAHFPVPLSSPVPSGGRSANPGAPGCSDHHFLPPGSTGDSAASSRAASSAVPCQCAVPGQLAALHGNSMGTTAKCVTMGPADCRERLHNPVWFSTTSIQLGFSHSAGPRAGSSN